MFLLKYFREVRFNWLYVVGEVLLIFIGITLSQIFEDWRDDRAGYEKQHELLIVLRKSIENDLDRLNTNIATCRTTLRMHRYLIEHLDSSVTVNDSLSLALSYIGSNPGFKADMTGYKTIEAVGLINIKDHTLRAQIIDYYQVIRHYETWGDNVGDFLQDNFSPYVLTHFSDYNFMEKGIPYDLNAIRKDRVFRNVIRKANRLTTVTLEGLEFHKKYTEDFLAALPKQ